MQVLTFRAFRKDNIYFRTIEEREKITGHNLGNSQVSVNRTIGPTLVSLNTQERITP